MQADEFFQALNALFACGKEAFDSHLNPWACGDKDEKNRAIVGSHLRKVPALVLGRRILVGFWVVAACCCCKPFSIMLLASQIRTNRVLRRGKGGKAPSRPHWRRNSRSLGMAPIIDSK
eukprot:scaffold254409_cov17-Tisochrysis_lutea.AAC.1